MPQAVGFVVGLFTTGAVMVPGAMAVGVAAGATIAATTLGGLAVKLLTTVAISALSSALQKKPAQGGGLTVSATVRGEQNAETITLGTYATGGQLVYYNSHGPSRKYLQHVVELCSAPGAQLQRLVLNDQWVPLGSDAHAEFGRPVVGTSRYAGRVWVKYYDGRQTAADPGLVSRYANDEALPWTTAHIGSGLCYAILTFQYDQENMGQVPRYRFELSGIPLYDLRKDSTTGGSGSHRLNDPLTWEPSNNPVVQIWNLMRGIPLPGGEIYGGGYNTAMLPRSVWVAQMARCDVPVALKKGGTEPTYRSGLEIALTAEPADPITEFLKACSGEIADEGWGWTILAGAPALPVFAFSDDDVLVSKPQELDPFPGLQDVHNAITAQYPDPEELYETKEAPIRTDAAAEASDRFGRRTATVQLPAVPYGRQVQRQTKGWLADERRLLKVAHSLSGDTSHVGLLDTMSWTSARNGYVGKSFSVSEIVEELRTGVRKFSMRERDPSDYSWNPDLELTVPAVLVPAAPTPEVVSGLGAAATILQDASGRDRIASILLSWSTDIEARGIRWEIRKVGSSTVLLRGSTQDVAAGAIRITEGLIPGESYEIRARLILNRLTSWSAWLPVTLSAVRLVVDDLPATTPDIPTGLSLTTVLTAEMAKITASWTAPTSVGSGIRGYDVRIRQGAGNDISAFTTGTQFEWTVPRNAAHTVSVRAVDRLGNLSNWSTEVTITSAADAVPPAVPAGLAAQGGSRSIWLSWTPNTEADFSHYEICERTAATPGPGAATAATFSTKSSVMARTGLDHQVTRHYWIRAVDTSGNKSAWSNPVQAATIAKDAVTTADLQGLINATSFASSVKPIEVVAALPEEPHVLGRQVFLTADQKLYRNTGSGWTREVDGADLKINSVTTGALRAASVSSEQLAAGAAVISKLGIMDWMNLVPGADLADPAAWAGENGSSLAIALSPSVTSWEGQRVINQSGGGRVVGLPFGVDAGAKLWVRAKASVTGGSAVTAQLRIYFFEDPTTPAANAPYIVNIGTTTATGATEIAGEVEVPAGCTYARLVLAHISGSGTTRWGAMAVRRKNGGELIIDGTVKANHLTTTSAVITGTVQIADAIITSAKIVDLVASKLTVPPDGSGINPLIQVGATGVTLGAVESRAADPAARINAHSTTVDAGKILVFGASTLADWRKGGDLTKIDGGALSANTVSANKLEIGSRNVTLTGLQFEHNSPAANQVSWTAGQIRYINDAGSSVSAAIAAGSATWTSGVLYIYWAKDSNALAVTTAQNTAFAQNNFILGTYQGGILLDMDYGRTIVDGDQLKTGTVKAGAVDTDSFSAAGLAIFGGAAKSTGYVAGASGWRIGQDGDAEFNNLVTRGWIREGAVSDGPNVTYAGPYATPASGAFGANALFNIAPPALGRPISVDDHFLISVGIDLRTTTGTFKNQYDETVISRARARARFQYRLYRDGAWGSYFDQNDLATMRQEGTAWEFYSFSATHVARAENIQWRVQLFYTKDGQDNTAVEGQANGHNGFDFARNLQICVRAVKR